MSVKIKDIKTKVIQEDVDCLKISFLAYLRFLPCYKHPMQSMQWNENQASFVGIKRKIYCDLKNLVPVQGRKLIKILCNKFGLTNNEKRFDVKGTELELGFL